MRKIFILALVLLAMLALGSLTAAAQPAAQAQAPTPTLNQINGVAKELWCPLCNGVRLDNCELQACVQMREVISQKLQAGESKESIKAYFVQQYGDVVLGQPPRQGFNLIAYVFPILAAVVGIGWVTYLVLSWRKRQAPNVRPVKAAQVNPSASTTSTTAPSSDRVPAGKPLTARKPGEDTDEYMKRVERELRDTE